MQHIVEDAVRLVGCVILFAATLGRYRGPQNDGLLVEGAAGLAAVAVVSYVLIVFT